MNEREKTAREIALEDTVEGRFLEDLLQMFVDLDDLEEGGPEHSEVVPAINRIEKIIHEAAGLPTDDFIDFPMIEDPEEAADIICESLKKWILEIEHFKEYKSYKRLVAIDSDKLEEVINQYARESKE